jgi:hypothetical protein
MKKIFLFIFIIISSSLIAGCSFRAEKASEQSTMNNISVPTTNVEQKAKILEVYYFHRTARCTSCRTVGRFVREAMEQKFGDELANGTIDYRELNIEMPENKDIAEKYQASGSALYMNRINDGQDNIEQDIEVWNLMFKEDEFKAHLENKIKSYLHS